MNTLTTKVLRQKTAKGIMDICFNSDKSCAYFASEGAIDVTGELINATARKIKGTGKDKGRSWWLIHIESNSLDLAPIKATFPH